MELASRVAADTRYLRKDVLEVIDSFLHHIERAVLLDQRVELRGFGCFSLKKYKSRPVNFFCHEPGNRRVVKAGRSAPYHAIRFKAYKKWPEQFPPIK